MGSFGTPSLIGSSPSEDLSSYEGEADAKRRSDAVYRSEIRSMRMADARNRKRSVNIKRLIESLPPEKPGMQLETPGAFVSIQFPVHRKGKADKDSHGSLSLRHTKYYCLAPGRWIFHGSICPFESDAPRELAADLRRPSFGPGAQKFAAEIKGLSLKDILTSVRMNIEEGMVTPPLGHYKNTGEYRRWNKKLYKTLMQFAKMETTGQTNFGLDCSSKCGWSTRDSQNVWHTLTGKIQPILPKHRAQLSISRYALTIDFT